jgi:copper transporter 1
MHMMQMYFEAGTHVTLWLRSWHTSTHLQYAISVVGLLLLAVIAECLAALRARLARAAAAPGGAGSGNAVWPDDAGAGPQSAAEPLLGFVTARASTPARLRAVLALLYAVNIAVAYLLMLAVMTYNVGYFVAIVAGFGLGHFAFADLKAGGAVSGDACCPQP